MYPEQNDYGLGGSLLIYGAAIIGALLVLVTPVYLANAPTVYQNAGVESFDQILPGRDRNHIPLARLERQSIVDPAVVAALNEKAQDKQARAERAAPSEAAARPAERERRPRYAEGPRPQNPFALFFSLFN